MPGQTEMRAPDSSPRAERPSCAIVRDWYAGSLRGKLVQAVAEGRADAGRAVELHRLMAGLVEPERRAQARADPVATADRRAPR